MQREIYRDESNEGKEKIERKSKGKEGKGERKTGQKKIIQKSL